MAMRQSFKIIGSDEGAKVQAKGTENLFNEIIEEKLPNLEKDIDIQVQEALRTPNICGQKRSSPCHITVTLPKIMNKESILKLQERSTKSHRKASPTA
jgi:hypothetical protein